MKFEFRKLKIKKLINNPKSNIRFRILICSCTFLILILGFICFAQEAKKPILVNGDKVEYSTDAKEVTVEGNVLVIYEDSRLTCEKITVNTQTKEGVAEGNVRLEDKQGVLEAERLKYNFESKTGKIIEAKVTSEPYFGRGETVERISEDQFNIQQGYITTCDYDIPHYRISSKEIECYPGDKVTAKQAKVEIGKVPIFFFPRYTHSLKDPFMHVRFIPGKRKEWGAYMLSAWRYNLTQNMRGRIYLDYRDKLGVAQGFGLNYSVPNLGKGDFKFYYTQERARDLVQGSPNEFQRYLTRWRHIWQIDRRTRATLEYYKIFDARREVLGTEYNFLKDYFYREYEKDSMPKTYLSVTRTFDNASLNFLLQKRINPWYTHTDKVPDEKLPEVTFDLPSYKIGKTPLYFKSQTKFSNLANKNATPSNLDDDVVRVDAYNQLSFPQKLAFLAVTPHVGVRETYYSKDKNGDSLDPRTAFYSGIDVSTKFYRMFNLATNFLGLDINGLRHVITPVVKYAFINEPTVPRHKLQTFDLIDTVERVKRFSFELVNKLQTKRKNKTVDLARLKVTTDYNLVRGVETGKGFSEFLFDLELIPYAWLRMESEVIYEPRHSKFKSANFDISMDLGKERALGMGYRYERGGGKELTMGFSWRFSPKWKFRMYERYQFADSRERGLKEQEYAISRDLHCWTLDFAYNISKEHGHTVWIVLKVKAFPEIGIEFDQSYHSPKSNP